MTPFEASIVVAYDEQVSIWPVVDALSLVDAIAVVVVLMVGTAIMVKRVMSEMSDDGGDAGDSR